MAGGRQPATAPQHKLRTHEFAVVFADGAGRCHKTGVGAIGACCPLPQHPMAVEQGFPVHCSGVLPFRFCRQPGITPAGEGIRFKPAQVPHRSIRIQRLAAGQGEFLLYTTPVARADPAVLLTEAPAFTHPEIRARVTTVRDEGLERAIAHQVIADLEPIQPRAMTGTFVVEVEARSPMADGHQTFVAAQPSVGCGLDAEVCLTVIARFQRLTAEAIQEVHQQQLLMLLFVLQTQLQELKTRFIGCLEQLLQTVIHP